MPPLWFHHYSLRLRGPHTANAASQLREIHGCLLRSDDGFACLQPWPELGDLPLEHQLKLLKAGQSSRLIARALDCMAADAAALTEVPFGVKALLASARWGSYA